MRRTLLVAAGMLIVAAAARPAMGQDFKPGFSDIGPTIGLGGIGSATLAIGGRFEHAIKALPDLGGGTLGIEVSADYYHWSNADVSWSYIPIGATANYHFKLADEKLDPFLGLGLGFQVISCSFPGGGSNGCNVSSGIYAIGRAGARYFWKPDMAFYGDVGAGAAALNLGVMFKLK